MTALAPFRAFRARRGRSRGAAAVEYALVTPVFLTIVFGMVDYGWLFWQHTQANRVLLNAMRVGGLTAPADGEADGSCVNCIGNVTDRAYTDLVALGFAIDRSDVTPTLVDVGGSCTLVLEVEADFEPIVNLLPTPEKMSFTVHEIAQGVHGC